MTMKNKIISIDSSTSRTGWAFWENGQLVNHGLIDLHKIDIPELRMRHMVNEIQRILDLYAPDCVVAELTAVIRNEQTQRMLTMILGAILGWCVEYEKEFETLRPTEWRSYVQKGINVKKRDELKSWAIKKARELFDVSSANDDEAEGILIGFAYIKHMEELGNDIQ